MRLPGSGSSLRRPPRRGMRGLLMVGSRDPCAAPAMRGRGGDERDASTIDKDPTP